MMQRETVLNTLVFLAMPAVAVIALALDEPFTITLATRAAILALAAVGLNLALGLGGLVSLGHAVFFGLGGYAMGILASHAQNYAPLDLGLLVIEGTKSMPVIWLTAVVVSALAALLIGLLALRTAGVYFIMITLAFAQMSYNLAYSVLTPITQGETGLTLNLDDPRILDAATTEGSLPFPSLFGLEMNQTWVWTVMGHDFQFNTGYYFCGAILILGFYIAMRIFRSPFGLMLRAVKTNQNRLNYTGINTRPYALAAFVISGMYAGLAGGLLAVTDPLAGAERMQWTASGEVVLMTILGGMGTLLGPVLGAGIIKYMEQIISSLNEQILTGFFGSFLPEALTGPIVSFASLFVGEGWHLLLGLVFMLIVTFLPGGVMEGVARIMRLLTRKREGDDKGGAPAPTPAE